MYCRGASAVILTYDVTNWQSLTELEDRFLSLTDTANADCIYAIVGNKADLTESSAQGPVPEDGQGEQESVGTELRPTGGGGGGGGGDALHQKQVNQDDALALYARVLRYKGLDGMACPPGESLCFETSAKTGYNVDVLFETIFDMVLPSILKKRREGEPSTVDLEDCRVPKSIKGGCCAWWEGGGMVLQGQARPGYQLKPMWEKLLGVIWRGCWSLQFTLGPKISLFWGLW